MELIPSPAMCSISDVVQVTFPDAAPIVLRNFERRGDAKFLKLAKSDPTVVRLITGHGVGEARMLAKTNIIEQLVVARNNKRQELLDGFAAATGAAGAEDLGVDDDEPLPKKKPRRFDAQLPEIISIIGPSVEGVAGRSMNVLMARPEQALWVEISCANFDYIRDVATCQIESGAVQVAAPGANRGAEDRVPKPCRNVVWAYDRKSFRARFKDEEGARHTKDFKQASLAEAFMRSGFGGAPGAIGAIQDGNLAPGAIGAIQDDIPEEGVANEDFDAF